MSTSSAIDAAFRALDVKGRGEVTADDLVAFTESIRRQLPEAEVLRIASLQSSIRDGLKCSVASVTSSSIPQTVSQPLVLHRAAFGRVMRMLCSVASSRHQQVTVGELLERYESAQQKVLFDLLDESGCGSVTSGELRPLTETLTQVLGLKAMCDVGILLRSVGVDAYGSISQQQFATILAKLMGSGGTKGTSAPCISHVVAAFREKRNKMRKVLTASRLQRLSAAPQSQSRPRSSSLHGGLETMSDGGESMLSATRRRTTQVGDLSPPHHSGRECTQCSLHAQRIVELEQKVRALENQVTLLQKGGVVSDHEDGDGDGDADNGVVPTVHSMDDRKAPQSRRGTFEQQSRDLLASDTALTAAELFQRRADSGAEGVLMRAKIEGQILSQWLAELGAAVPMSAKPIPTDVVERLLPQCRESLETGRSLVDSVRQLCGSMSNLHHEPQTVDAALHMIHTMAPAILSPRDAVGHRLLIVAAAPLSTVPPPTMHTSAAHNKRRRGVWLAMEFGAATLEFVDWCHRVLFLCKQVDGVAKTDERTETKGDEMELLELFGDPARVVFSRLEESAERACEAIRGEFIICQRDRCCQASFTSTSDDISHGGSPKEHTLMRRVDPNAAPGVEAMTSRPPRFRGKRPWEGRGGERVDALLSQLLMHDGIQVPPNFGRIPASDSSPTSATGSGGGNKFFFGTKRIEIAAVDDQTLCVPVGGGFLLFTEYCKQHAAFESALWLRRHQQASQSLSPGR